ncbi:MAG: tryptophan synthase subunit alpha [Hadesarchaea archaeon]|nr:tryptophan synthase subunit alpha [Hadesarchaea archaeon]
MSRLAAKFKELRRKREGALIAFVTAGDPKPAMTQKIVETLSKHADIIELGIPFSDPIADGPTIQGATDRALKAGTTPETVRGIIKKIRRRSEVPLVVLTYYNIVFKPGVDDFVRRFAAAGMDGIIIPDLPVEEAGKVLKATKKHGVDLIFLVAPTTTPKRLKRICKVSSGFIYVVSLLGVTGAREKLSDLVRPLIARVQKASRVPVAVGFGISKPEHVATVIKSKADGAIVGSAFVNFIAKNLNNERKMLQELDRFGKALKLATKISR